MIRLFKSREVAADISGKSPGYFAKRRLFQNYPAVFGMVVISVALLAALLGYGIMPDDTPNANARIPEIKKQGPGFKATLLLVRKNGSVDVPGFLSFLWEGAPSAYLPQAVASVALSADSSLVTATIFGGEGHHFLKETYPLADVVLPLYSGTTQVLDPVTKAKFEVQNTGVTYVDLNGSLQKVSKIYLVDTFYKEHLIQKTYWLGTDASGRDLLSKLIFGTRISLAIGIITVVISMVMGIFMGALAGFFRGWVDQLIMWLMTVIWSIPRIMLVIAIGMALHTGGVWVTFVAVGLTMWVEVARVVRGKILEIKESLYVESARAIGLSTFRIIFRHMLPNLLGPLIVILTANFADAILIEAGLSFLGLSVQPPMPSWGQMVQEGYSLITSPGCWHLILFPSLCISLLVLAFNLLGNGLRDAFDPKSAHSHG